jgi:two-component system nitrate/nitrite response regulator NarL
MSAVHVGVLSGTRLFVEGVSRIVSAEPAIELVEIGNEEALITGPPVVSLQVLLLDGRMERALALCRRFGSEPDLKILVLSVPDDWPLAPDLLLAGARGILRPDARTPDLIKAIALVQQGKIWAPRHVVAAAWTKCMLGADHGQRIASWPSLSVREREVARHAVAGFANKEVADRLAISEATVKVHLTHIFQKVGCRSRAELTAAYHGISRSPSDAGWHPPVIVRPSAN